MGMTRDEALKVWLPVIQIGVETMPECKEALDMAIKALEQEPILDKIRAQIAELSHYYPMGHDYQIAITRYNGGHMRTILDYIFCFIIKRLPPCKIERWMIRQLITWIRK